MGAIIGGSVAFPNGLRLTMLRNEELIMGSKLDGSLQFVTCFHVFCEVSWPALSGFELS